MIDEAQPFWRLRRDQESRKLDAGRDHDLGEMSRNATGAIALSAEPSSMVRAQLTGRIFGHAGKEPRES
jgi:hypothetical protein